jgi:CheY-like chemotaxis protein
MGDPMDDGEHWLSCGAHAGGRHGRFTSHSPGQRLLVLEDDPQTSELLALALASLRLEIVPALNGSDALEAVRRERFDMLLVDLGLPDIPGLEVVRTLRAQNNRTPFVVISGLATVPAVVESMRLGALAVFEKPVALDDLMETVVRELWSSAVDAPAQTMACVSGVRPHAPPAGPPTPGHQPRSPVERWALFVMKAVYADHDPRTLDSWARSLGVSRSVLCESCRIVHISPRDARDFARLLRAVVRSGGEWRPETIIDFADARTLRNLERRVGISCSGGCPGLEVDEFLWRQRLIPADHPGLSAVRCLVGQER